MGRARADDRYEPDEIDPTRMEVDSDEDENENEEEARDGDDPQGSDEGWEEVSREEGMIIDYVILSKALRRPAFG
jgi:hypothetical protein